MERQVPGTVRKIQNESVAVIGSGIAGCLTAYELAGAGYSVTLVEERDGIFSGTSAHPIQAHLGGLYSGSPTTAKECLHAAIALKKAFPIALTERKASFLVADESDLTLTEFVRFYHELTDYYASLPVEDQVFGHPENFFRALKPEEYSYAKNVEGGIITQEPGLNIASLRAALLHKFKQLSVRILTGTSVVGVKQYDDRFILTLKTGGIARDAHFDQVVNASGYKARLLDHMLGDTTEYHLFLKAWNVVRPLDKQPPLQPFIIVRGSYIHYSPIGNSNSACLLAPKEGLSYLASTTYDAQNPHLPTEWLDILEHGVPNKREHFRKVMEYAGDNFLHNPQFEPVDVIPGVAVSYSKTLQDRTGRGVREIVPGWYTAVPTKATTALLLARSATVAVTAHSDCKAPYATPVALAT